MPRKVTPKGKGSRAEKVRQARARTVDKLDVSEKMLRDHFVTQYLIDFRAMPALRRACGVLGIEKSTGQIQSQAWQLLEEPYIAYEVQKAIDTIQEKNLINRNRIVAGLVREAHHEGPAASHAARVGAWSKLANIMKMDVKQIEANLSSKGGILLVPATQRAEDWEARAKAAQAALKEEVRK